MERELKKKWVEALRSGKYQKGTGYLERHDISGTRLNCCLGVLCQVMEIPSKVDGNSIRKGDGIVEFTFPTMYSVNLPERAEMEFSDAMLTRIGLTRNDQGTLINMNDGFSPYKMSSFGEIADWIEENVQPTA